MWVGVFNIGVGVLAIVLGASGHVSLIGTSSSTALVVFGVLAIAFGAFQVVKSRR